MAVADTLNTLITDLQSAYNVLNTKGGIIPEHKNTNNLAETIQSLNVGNITTEVVKKTLTAEATGISFSITSGKIPKLVILTSANYDTDGYSDLKLGEIRYVDYFADTNSGISETRNKVNGQTQFARAYNGADSVQSINITLTNNTVSFSRRSNTYYLADVEYKLTAYYWGDENIPSFTADTECTNALACKTLLTPHVTDDNAYTIFTTDLENNKLNNQMCYVAYSKINGTVWCISGTRYSTSNGRITQVADMNNGNTSAYTMIINKGWKIYKTVIKLDGSAFNDTSDIDNLIAGTMPNVEFESVKSIGANFFQNNQTIKSVSFPNSTNTGTTGFYDCKQLESIYFPKATQVNNYSFRNCVKLTNVKLESVTTLNDYCFQGCLGLETMNLPKCTSISLTAFVGGLSKFDTLVLGSDTVCALAGVGAFVNTPFRNGTGGTVYVPSALVSTYESATNWSSLESTTFAAIEDNIATLEALGLNVDEFKT